MNKVWILCVLSLIGCGGRVSEENDGTGSRLNGGAEASSPGLDLDGGPSAASSGRCQVDTLVGSPGAYSVALTEAGGTTKLEEVGGRFHIVCLADGKTRLSLWTNSIADGRQPIATGELVIEGLVSDRPCTVALQRSPMGGPKLTGFLECPHEPFVDDSLFCRSNAPIGLGAFDVELTP